MKVAVALRKTSEDEKTVVVELPDSVSIDDAHGWLWEHDDFLNDMHDSEADWETVHSDTEIIEVVEETEAPPDYAVTADHGCIDYGKAIEFERLQAEQRATEERIRAGIAAGFGGSALGLAQTTAAINDPAAIDGKEVRVCS